MIGQDRIIWGSDHSQPCNTFPDSRDITKRHLPATTDRVIAAAAGPNCARLFNLEVPSEAIAATDECSRLGPHLDAYSERLLTWRPRVYGTMPTA